MKFLLVAMANYADENGICYPSVRRLTEDTEQDRKTILKHIAKLESIHLLEDTNRRCGQTHSVPIYRLLISSPKSGTATTKPTEQSQKRDTLAGEAVPFFPGSSPVFPPKQSQKRDTDPSGTVSDPPKGGVAASRSPKNKDGSEVFLLNQALEIAPPSAKKELLRKKRAVLGKHFSVDLSPKPSVTASSSSEISIPPADPATIQKHIDEAKAAVAAATPARTVKRTIKEQRQKLPA